MRLWNLLKENMQKTPEQIVCEGKAEMTYEELIVYAEHFSTQLKGEKCCAILCGSEMVAAMALGGLGFPIKRRVTARKREASFL